MIGDNNKPIEGGPINTTASIPTLTLSYGYSLTTTFTTTSIPSIMSFKTASTTAKIILIPIIKPLKK